MTLVAGGRDLGTVELGGVSVVYSKPQQQAGERQATGQPRATAEPEPFTLPPGLSCEVRVKGFTVEYRAEQQQPVFVTMDEGWLKMPDLRDISMRFDLAVRVGQETGQASLAGEVLNLFDPDGVMQQMEAHYDLSSTVVDVPVGALDRVVRQAIRGGGLKPGSSPGARRRQAQRGGDGQRNGGRACFLPHRRHAQLHVELYQAREGDMLVASPGNQTPG